MKLFKVVNGVLYEYAVFNETDAGCHVVRKGNPYRRPRWLVRGKDFDCDDAEFLFEEDVAWEAHREFQG